MGEIIQRAGVAEEDVTGILPRYVARQFLGLFLFTLLGAALLFVVLDVVENVDQFIDAKAPGRIVVLFYLFSVPYYMVLAMPFATLLAGVFSVGALAKHNEIVAMKALGYSFYQTLRILLFLGFAISVFSFVLLKPWPFQPIGKRAKSNANIWTSPSPCTTCGTGTFSSRNRRT